MKDVDLCFRGLCLGCELWRSDALGAVAAVFYWVESWPEAPLFLETTACGVALGGL